MSKYLIIPAKQPNILYNYQENDKHTTEKSYIMY
jgi:hypothetical protein